MQKKLQGGKNIYYTKSQLSPIGFQSCGEAINMRFLPLRCEVMAKRYKRTFPPLKMYSGDEALKM